MPRKLLIEDQSDTLMGGDDPSACMGHAEGAGGQVASPLRVPAVLRAAALRGSGVIGSEVTVVPGAWRGKAEVMGHWLADGVPLGSGAAEARLTLTAALDGTTLCYREMARNAAGSAQSDSNVMMVHCPAPECTGALCDEVFDHANGYGEIPTAQVFAGDAMHFVVSGGNALINAKSGLVQIPTDAAQEGALVTVTARNSGGQVSTAFQVTVEQDPTEITAVTQIQAEGVVFQFDREIEAGTFANGDWFVIANGAALVEVLPTAQQVSTDGYVQGTGPSRWINGLEVEMSFLDAQGFDSYVPQEGAETRHYEAARNLDPGATGEALALRAGQQIVKAVSVAQDPERYAGRVSDLRNPIAKFVTLTVVERAPPPGAFRPPLRGWDGQTYYTQDMVDWTQLPQVDVSTLLPNEGPDDVESPFPFWLDGSLRGKAATSTAVDQSHGDAAQLGAQVAQNLMWLCGDVPFEEKRLHGVDLIQAGLDGLLTRKDRPRGYGGQGLVAAGTFAALMLDQPELRVLAQATPNWPGNFDTLGQEQHQVFALPQAASEVRVLPNKTDPNAHFRQQYQMEQEGLPDWEAFDPGNTPAFPEVQGAPLSETKLPISGAALAVIYGPDPAFQGPTEGDFYVAPDGDDSNVGTDVAAPYATLQKAIDVADAAGGAQTILLRGGTYRQQATLAGVTADLTFAAYADEAPILSAAEVLSGWNACGPGDEETVGPDFARMYKAQVDLKGLQHGEMSLLNLYENGIRCDIAQDRMIDTNPHAWGDDATFHTGRFNVKEGLIQSITDGDVLRKYTSAQAKDVTVAFYNGDNRATETTFSAFDPVTATGTLADQSKREHRRGAVSHRYCLINATHAITQGRWACQRNGDGTGTVYFWPHDPRHLEAGVEYSVRTHVIDLADVQGNITFRGLRAVRAAGNGRDTGMCIGSRTQHTKAKAGRIRFENCVLGECGGNNYGVAYLREFQGGVQMRNCALREGNSHGPMLVLCPNSWVDQCRHEVLGRNAMRCYSNEGLIWSYSTCNDTARNTHANFFNIYQQSDRVLVYGVKTRNNFGYLTWSQASNVVIAFCDIQVNGSPTDDRALANQNRAPGGTLGGADGSGVIEGGTRFYIYNNATRPGQSGEAPNSISMGSRAVGAVGEVYTVQNNILHGLSDRPQAIDVQAGNVYSGLNKGQLPQNMRASETFQAASEMYLAPDAGDYTPRAGAMIRGRTGEDITGVVAAVQSLFRGFPHFDKDMEGRAFAAATPPVGPHSVLPEAPAEPPDAYGPVTLKPHDVFDLGAHTGWSVADGFTLAFRFTWTDTSAITWLASNGLHTYIAVNPKGSLRVRVRRADGSDLFLNTAVPVGWSRWETHSVVFAATRTRCQIWVDGRLRLDVTKPDAGPLRVPVQLGMTNKKGAPVAGFDIAALWYALEGMDAVRAGAALFASPYAPTLAMRQGAAVEGVAPVFFEARSAAWPRRAGWRGAAGPVSLYQGAEITRTDRAEALRGLVPTALALHLMPGAWEVSGAVQLRDYLDRVMGWFEQYYVSNTTDFADAGIWGPSLAQAVTPAEYAFYRDVIVPQISVWRGVPEVPLPPQVRFDAAVGLVVTAAPYAPANNSPIAQRNIRFFINRGRDWTVVEDIPAEFVIGGVKPGDRYAVQIQHVNAQGPGGWSYNAPLMGGPAAGPARAAGIV